MTYRDRRREYEGRTVAVTGADGFIGSHLVETLAAAGAHVRALALYTSFGTAGWLDELDPALAERVEIVRGDVRDPFQTDGFVAGADVVFHLAALIAIPFSYVAPQSYVEVNVQGTVNVLEACRRHGPARMVHTSTSEVYGTARRTPIDEDHPLQGQSPYSASKIGADHMVEAYARSFDLPAVILRPFNTFGPRQSERAVIPTVIRQALDPACPTIRLGSLEPVRDFSYVADVVDAFLAAGAAPGIEPGMAYNAGSGRAVTIGEVVERARVLSGIDKPVETETSRLRPGRSEVFELLADARRFRAAAGWQPAHDLDAGLVRTIEWWRGRIAGGLVRRDASYLI